MRTLRWQPTLRHFPRTGSPIFNRWGHLLQGSLTSREQTNRITYTSIIEPLQLKCQQSMEGHCNSKLISWVQIIWIKDLSNNNRISNNNFYNSNSFNYNSCKKLAKFPRKSLSKWERMVHLCSFTTSTPIIFRSISWTGNRFRLFTEVWAQCLLQISQMWQ